MEVTKIQEKRRPITSKESEIENEETRRKVGTCEAREAPAYKRKTARTVDRKRGRRTLRTTRESWGRGYKPSALSEGLWGVPYLPGVHPGSAHGLYFSLCLLILYLLLLLLILNLLFLFLLRSNLLLRWIHYRSILYATQLNIDPRRNL